MTAVTAFLDPDEETLCEYEEEDIDDGLLGDDPIELVSLEGNEEQ
jgi:hypothetical protein